MLEDTLLMLLAEELEDETETDELLLDEEVTLLTALLELEDELTALLDDELEDCEEIIDELLLTFPAALGELLDAVPLLHAVANAEVISTHAIPTLRFPRTFIAHLPR